MGDEGREGEVLKERGVRREEGREGGVGDEGREGEVWREGGVRREEGREGEVWREGGVRRERWGGMKGGRGRCEGREG